jgi:patatin-related protein
LARKVLAMTEQDAHVPDPANPDVANPDPANPDPANPGPANPDPANRDGPKPGQAIPMTPLTQAVRIATTMTGGVSLAVWMGGVAYELSLLGQASNLRRRADPVRLPDNDPRRGYLDLLNLLDVTVDFDVLSGTSAGGINAALLAYSRAEQKDLGSLRKLWLEMGAMETLLRNPTDTEMPSLLQGDAQMYASLCTAIPNLTDAEFRAPTDDRSTTLFVTTTLLTGETSRFTDSYGTLLQDVDHRGMFRFESDGTQTAAGNQGNQGNHGNFDPAALALAARSSASFPAAFEPSFVPFAAEVPGKNGVPARPPMGSRSNLTRDHWAADGGLLDNQPIDALLETIFERPAKRLVRRVLLYIVPSGGPAPNPLAVPRGDDVNRPYSMISGLLKDVSAVWNQSISADLRAIREHNDRIGARTDTRLRLAQLAARWTEKKPADPLQPLLTEPMFADYCTHEADAIGAKLVAQVMRQLTTWPVAANANSNGGNSANANQDGANSANANQDGANKDGGRSIPSQWATALAPGGNAEQACRLAIRTALTERWQPLPTSAAELARFGRPAYYGAKAIALSLLRCRFLVAEWKRTQPDPELARFLASQVQALHDSFQPLASGDVAAFVTEALTAGGGQAKARLDELRRKPIAEAVAELAGQYLDRTAKPTPQRSTPAGDQPAGEQPVDSASLADAWPNLGAVVARLLVDPKLDHVPAPSHTVPGSRDEQIAQAAEHLRIYADYLSSCTTDDSRALRLFALYATHRAMLPIDIGVEQPVELIQLSADTRTLLDLGRSTAKSKLTGMQLDHFGAFLKRAWRANDWMWGRLDGAGWLVHLLLDPRRISMILSSAHGSRVDEFLAMLSAIGVPTPPADGIPIGPPEAPGDQRLSLAEIRAELIFLDDTSTLVPASLPLTSLWVARGLQQQIGVREMTELADEFLTPNATEPASGAERSWARDVQEAAKTDPLAKAGQLLISCPVPDERMQKELGTPLMVRTAAKTAAVTAAAVHAMPQVPPPMRPLTSTLRTVTLGGYRVTNLVKALPRRMILAGLVLLLVGALFATAQSTVFGLTGVLIAAIGGYLVVFGAWQLSRGVLAAVISATLVGAAASLTIPSVRRGLFGQRGGKSGWLNERVLWLGEQWWHPLVGLGAVLVLLALIGVLFARGGRPHSAIHRMPRVVALICAVVVALAVVAALAVALGIKGS